MWWNVILPVLTIVVLSFGLVGLITYFYIRPRFFANRPSVGPLIPGNRPPGGFFPPPPS